MTFVTLIGINNTKFDCRVYFLVTSFDPLIVYRYEDGLVRFATQPYTLKGSSLKNTKVHLTNYSINKKSDAFVKNTDSKDDGMGSKWGLPALRTWFAKNGIDHEVMTLITLITLITLALAILTILIIPRLCLTGWIKWPSRPC